MEIKMSPTVPAVAVLIIAAFGFSTKTIAQDENHLNVADYLDYEQVSDAQISPDGRQIVFSSNRSGSFKLYVVSTDGSNLRRLTRPPAGFEESSPSWTHRKLAP